MVRGRADACSIDLDLPTECDDEYCENKDPAFAFKQPAGKPSSVSFFVCLIKLNQVLSFAMRTIVGLAAFLMPKQC